MHYDTTKSVMADYILKKMSKFLFCNEFYKKRVLLQNNRLNAFVAHRNETGHKFDLKMLL